MKSLIPPLGTVHTYLTWRWGTGESLFSSVYVFNPTSTLVIDKIAHFLLKLKLHSHMLKELTALEIFFRTQWNCASASVWVHSYFFSITKANNPKRGPWNPGSTSVPSITFKILWSPGSLCFAGQELSEKRKVISIENKLVYQLTLDTINTSYKFTFYIVKNYLNCLWMGSAKVWHLWDVVNCFNPEGTKLHPSSLCRHAEREMLKTALA